MHIECLIFLMNRLNFHFCDIREFNRLVEILKDVNIVLHATVLKHLTVCEFNPFEAVKTNVIGTQNKIEACLRNEVEKRRARYIPVRTIHFAFEQLLN